MSSIFTSTLLLPLRLASVLLTPFSLLSAPAIRLMTVAVKSTHNLQYVDSCVDFACAAPAPPTLSKKAPRRSRFIVILNLSGLRLDHILLSSTVHSLVYRLGQPYSQALSYEDDSVSEHAEAPFRSTPPLQSLLPMPSFAGRRSATAQLTCDNTG